MQHQRQPTTGTDGSLYLTAMGGDNGWSLSRVDPATGAVLWRRSPFPSNGMSAPSLGTDGSVYFSRSLSYLDSYTASGQSRWTFFDGSIIDHPAVSPNSSVVVAGSGPNFGEPGSIGVWDAATGRLQGRTQLSNEDGGYQIAYTQPRFSADSSTAYVGTAVLGGGWQRLLLRLRRRHGDRDDVASAASAAHPQCVVPNVVGTTLANGQAANRSGQVHGRDHHPHPVVGGQDRAGPSPAPGTKLPVGAAVNLTVGRR